MIYFIYWPPDWCETVSEHHPQPKMKNRKSNNLCSASAISCHCQCAAAAGCLFLRPNMILCTQSQLIHHRYLSLRVDGMTMAESGRRNDRDRVLTEQLGIRRMIFSGRSVGMRPEHHHSLYLTIIAVAMSKLNECLIKISGYGDRCERKRRLFVCRCVIKWKTTTFRGLNAQDDICFFGIYLFANWPWCAYGMRYSTRSQ